MVNNEFSSCQDVHNIYTDDSKAFFGENL